MLFNILPPTQQVGARLSSSVSQKRYTRADLTPPAACGVRRGGRARAPSRRRASIEPLSRCHAAPPLSPSRQLLCAQYTAACWSAPPGSGGGRLLVVGSAALFGDAWLLKEEGNARLADWAFEWLRPVSLGF